MKLTKKTIELICELEAIIGGECYNPNSYDGWTLEEGRAFRYPVTFDDKDGNEYKRKYNPLILACLPTIFAKNA